MQFCLETDSVGRVKFQSMKYSEVIQPTAKQTNYAVLSDGLFLTFEDSR
jgi:hypothetical protein